MSDANFKTIEYRAGIVRFSIPSHWTEEYGEAGGGLVSLASILVVIRAEPEAAPKPEPAQSIFTCFKQTVASAWHGGLRTASDSVSWLLSLFISGVLWWLLLTALILSSSVTAAVSPHVACDPPGGHLPSPMLIRPAAAADIPSILPMVAAICALHESWDKDKYSFLPDIVERYRRWFPQRIADPKSIFLVAELTPSTPQSAAGVPPASLAGYLIATVEPEVPIYTTREFGFIHDVWVEPLHRGKEIARHLVDAAVARFSDMGLSQVRLDVAAPNESARRLFVSCGFRESTTEMLRTLTRRAGP